MEHYLHELVGGIVSGAIIALAKLINNERQRRNDEKQRQHNAKMKRASDVAIEQVTKELSNMRANLSRLEGWKDGVTGEYRIPKFPTKAGE